MFKNLKIGSRVLVSFMIVGAIFLFVSVVAVYSGNSISKQMEKFYDGPYQVVNAVDSMSRSLREAEQRLLWASTTSDEQETEDRLVASEAAFGLVDEEVEKARELLKEDPELLQLLEDFDDLLLTQARPLRMEIMEYNRNGDVESAMDIYDHQYEPRLREAESYLLSLADQSKVAAAGFKEDALNSSNRTLVFVACLAAGTLALIAVLCGILTRSLVRPIKEVETAAQEISNGNLDIELKYQSKDELGCLADSMRTTIQVLSEMLRDVDYCLGEMAEGNFTVVSRNAGIYRGELSNLLASMKKIKSRLNAALSQINNAAGQVAASAEQVSSGAMALSQGATEQASSIEELAATITEISTQVQANAQNAELAKQGANTVGADMEQSNRKMQDMVEAMEIINNTSDEISKIIKTIEDIAFQTNILALNAAVEAARAGAAGKGFAVVADEVRNLASKSAEASKNTSALIERSITAVSNGSAIVDGTARSLAHAVSGVADVVKLVDQIAEASQMQSEAISQISLGVDQVSAVVQTNSATAEENTASSEELSGQAQVVQNLVAQFKLEGSANAAFPGIPYQMEPDDGELGAHLFAMDNKY